MEEDWQVWQTCSRADVWVYDKLLLALFLGHDCGPAGVPVEKPGQYIVRPITNMYGMGAGARVMWFDEDTVKAPPGSFWCEMFHGEHISVDYEWTGNLRLGYQPFRVDLAEKRNLRFHRWRNADHLDVPPFPVELCSNYPVVNAEFIGDRCIEVHLRGNPDPRDVEVVWDDRTPEILAPEDADGWIRPKRAGFDRL